MSAVVQYLLSDGWSMRDKICHLDAMCKTITNKEVFDVK